MNFKEALIAHLQGEDVEVVGKDNTAQPLLNVVGNNSLSFCLDGSADLCYKFRIKPRTIVVNDVEVPAPEKDVPNRGDKVFVADACADELYYQLEWNGFGSHHKVLSHGLIYLNKEDAIARAKAMLIYKEV